MCVSVGVLMTIYFPKGHTPRTSNLCEGGLAAGVLQWPVQADFWRYCVDCTQDWCVSETQFASQCVSYTLNSHEWYNIYIYIYNQVKIRIWVQE